MIHQLVHALDPCPTTRAAQTEKQTPRRLSSPDPRGILSFPRDAVYPPAVQTPDNGDTEPGQGQAMHAVSQPMQHSAQLQQQETDGGAATAGNLNGSSGSSKNGLPWVDPVTGWQVLVSGGYLRVHVHPKRFPAACAVGGAGAWRARVVGRGPGWWVVDKPAGMQVPPTVDNVRESVVACVEEVGGEGSEGWGPLL